MARYCECCGINFGADGLAKCECADTEKCPPSEACVRHCGCSKHGRPDGSAAPSWLDLWMDNARLRLQIHSLRMKLANAATAAEAHEVEIRKLNAKLMKAPVKFSTEFRRKTEGTTQRVMTGAGVVRTGKMTFRGSELWITDIEITIHASEVTRIEAAP